MEDRAHAIIAVAFLIALSVGGAALYVWLHRGVATTREYLIVSRYSVSGLQAESDVEFKGILVGKVKDIRFDPHNPKQVLIRIGVYPNAYISRATYAQLAYRGITGMAYIALSLDPNETDTPLPTNPETLARIPMQQNLLQALADSGRADIKHIVEILDSLNKMFNADNRSKFADVLIHLNQASIRLNRLEQELIPSAQGLQGVIANTKQVLEEIHGLVQHLDRLASAARQPLDEVGETAKSIKRLSKESHRMINRLTVDTVPELDRLLRNLERTSRHIDRLSQELERQPQSVIFGKNPPMPGPGEPGFKHPPARMPP